MPKSNIPVRICGSKTTTGCRTCKQRHIKCDEGKPSCLRCQKSNRECTYEETQPRNQQQTHRVGALAYRYRTYPNGIGPYGGVNPYASDNVVEIGALKYFAHRMGKDLAGCFSAEVWCEALPRVAQHEPAVWHAITAVSLVDTALQFDHSNQHHRSDLGIANQQYGKAMGLLNERIAKNKGAGTKDVALLCSILFAVFECLQNRVGPALQHISGGTKVLLELSNDDQPCSGNSANVYLDCTALQPVFLSLDSQAVQMGALPFRNYASLPSEKDRLKMPVSFKTSDEAHMWLGYIFNRMSHWALRNEPNTQQWTESESDWLLHESQRLSAQLIAWDMAFVELQNNHQCQPPVMLLLVERKSIQAFFGKELDGFSEMEWDKQLSAFTEAITYAEAYVHLVEESDQSSQELRRSSSTSHNQRRPIFTLAMDIVLPLFLISTKCRHSGVRRRALALLKVCGRKEGIWDSSMCAHVAEQMIDFEESAALEDGYIPESARIFGLDIRVDEEQADTISAKKLVVGESRTESVPLF